MISVFEFFILKLSYVAVFMKIREKFFDPSCKTYLTNQCKNEGEDEKKKENDFDF